MKLKEARLLGIKHCEENNYKYTYISYDDTNKFYLADKENNYTVFFLNKNGSLKPYLATKYSTDFHKELKRRKNHRRKNDKKEIIEIQNRDLANQDLEIEANWGD